ncbi:dihydroorotase family protein [Candidatus Bathyarchaeota archaeon]|jgi:dihydroorotase (multifunctional complex type)|nr:dihydroorotase family protein [Candidatus Bathyarchaeota archaeon]MBT4319699.1 dihydroorotase family protein [Candidatus Bathyarchaeota archaeon]MBT7187401.1 dihydroorotase family protein [Candidatus Bathyarchaeota archaeon]MBT7345625.1 dihydroorotase family protein [Candidatus Bathyarchaeota archaeon]
MDDLIFTNASILTENGIIKGSLAVKDGKITAVGQVSGQGAKRTVNVGGKLIAPGLVDLHVHFREPGFTQKEDFLTGTRAAAAGGVTTVVDEPNNSPVTNSHETIEGKRWIIEGKAYVDYMLQMAVYADGLDEIKKAREAGIIAFPVFDELGDRPTGMENTGVLYEALKRIKEVDGLALLNCRESDLVNKTMNGLKESGRNTLADYMDHFPHVAESLGGAKRILLAHDAGVRAHFREVSTTETVQMIKLMKGYMGKITAEVRPDHLFLNYDNTKNLGPYAQQWTPLRTKADSDALWEALNDGTVNVIASDHATHAEEEKKRGADNIWKSPPGLPAIESMLSLLLTAVNEGRLGLERLFECASTNPAKVIGLYPRKGTIKVGSDADLVVIDREKESVIRGENAKTKTHWTPYEGWEVKGVPVATYVRGIETYVDGEIVGEPGQGRFLGL